MKKMIISVMALAMAIGLTACGGGDSSASDKAVQTNEPSAASITMEATNWDFDQDEYRVKAGEPVNFLLTNAEGVHGVEIRGLGIQLDADKEVQYTINEAGTYDIVCNIICGTGHSTMTAKLVVE
ncbi:cytochrome c oxidase subunit II [Xylanibacillus composti]|uniref:Cytochrome oxidase subunit II copper A binding domain-containing protein n=1 Tax=Xylanibacillus composti TaxID=1572762 RepID=A0A8J4H713_9BACL|nr:cupredoxin domain-containing protein [Xylanibacillus composti]MDT9724675.1 cytochrome c oxidase subunit II [Xylanibacillus composti]GIQ70960.1 hypothetical protein XYCOK13_37840 [Xylanibacillus composti]